MALPIYSFNQLAEFVPKEQNERIDANVKKVKEFEYPQNTTKKVVIYALLAVGFAAAIYCILASFNIAPHCFNHISASMERDFGLLFFASACLGALIYYRCQLKQNENSKELRASVTSTLRTFSMQHAIDERIPELLKSNEILLRKESNTEYTLYVSNENSFGLSTFRKTIKIKDGKEAETELGKVIDAEFPSAKVITKEELSKSNNDRP